MKTHPKKVFTIGDIVGKRRQDNKPLAARMPIGVALGHKAPLLLSTHHSPHLPT